MTPRRSHYEMAFESYLNQRGTAYVAVEDVKHVAGKGRTGAKAFDYIIYPPGGGPCLVDVKGRKIASRKAAEDCRTNNWVTRGDLDGLALWQEAFGADCAAMFVFAFWLAGLPPETQLVINGSPLFNFAGRRYSFWLAPLTDYAAGVKVRSMRWDTVSVPREQFAAISKPLEKCWLAAPC